MANQLESSRSVLPQPLQWKDNDILDFPTGNPTVRLPQGLLFRRDRGPNLVNHKHNLDIAIAQLRTRFYYARFIVFRPLIYKALHSPELVTDGDIEYCTLAIRSVCMWPTSMAQPKDKKRSVPHQFTWTQNIASILLILRMTQEEGMLSEFVNNKSIWVISRQRSCSCSIGSRMSSNLMGLRSGAGRF